jgi:hypothetical protein
VRGRRLDIGWSQSGIVSTGKKTPLKNIMTKLTMLATPIYAFCVVLKEEKK